MKNTTNTNLTSFNNVRHLSNFGAMRGFTIVELLIVIVVIGILAAIVIVAYNGVTARAKTSKAQAAAALVQKKTEAYNAEVGSYPTTFALLTGASSTSSYKLVTGNTNGGANPVFAAIASAPTNEATVNMVAACTTPAGYAVGYWDYTISAQKFLYGNGATSSSTCTSYVAS